ncbi:hypothetical protein DFJ73DRAFT_823253 [Zopfochytrium polystomum]|nr:hypothetical protein DFJ73DRAFT_823253 [Zopfochytrium polystomum]
MSSSSGSVRLLSLTFQDLHLDKQQVVSVGPHCSLQDALATMAKHNVMTLPISSRAFPNKYVYILSSFDILLYLVSSRIRNKNSAPDLAKTTVEAAMTMDAEMESYRVFERDFRDTMESTMVAFAKGAHRALISDALGVSKSVVVTQSDILKYAHTHPDTLAGLAPALSETTLAKAGLVRRSVVTLRDSETALAGYTRMAEKKVMAVPVVDAAGLVVATLSASDLRGLSADSVEWVRENVLTFLEKMKSRLNLQKSAEPVSLTPNDTLQDAMNLMVERDIHRIWILDDMLRPIGVVSQSDIIGAIVKVPADKPSY